MKQFSFIVFIGVLALTGCDPFGDENLPSAITTIEIPRNRTEVRVGEPFQIRVKVKTVIDVDSLELRLHPVGVSGTTRYVRSISTPSPISVGEDEVVETVVETEIVIDELPNEGHAEYHFRVKAILPYQKFSSTSGSSITLVVHEN